MAALPLAVPIALPSQISEEQLALHQRRAQEAQAQQDFVTAIREYRILVRAVPGSAELKSNLGVVLYFHRDFQDAAEILRQAIAQRSDLYAPHLFLGLTMAQRSRPDDAVLELERAANFNGDDPLVHTWLGYEYTAQSRFEKAAAQLQIAARQKPDDADVWYALGRSYLELGKTATDRLLRSNPDSGRVWQLAAEQKEAQGNREKALKLYIEAMQRRPDIQAVREKIERLGGTAPAVNEMPAANHDQEDALYAQIEGFEEQARAAFERISILDPDSYQAHRVLSDSDAAADRYDDAIREYRLVLKKKPNLPGIHTELCNALSRTARIQEAIKECEAEIALSPFSADAYVQAARVHLLADDDTRAAVLLEKALKLDRPPIAAYKLLGKVCMAQKRYPDAIRALNRYLAVETRDSSAFYLLARAYKASGDQQKMNQAIAEYKKTSGFARPTGEVSMALSAVGDDDPPSDENGQERGSPF